VIDIDSTDCLVAEDLLQYIQPKILVIEIAFHIPPPLRFSAHYHHARATERQRLYDVTKLNPSTGCSLSYALHKFRPYGMQFLQLTPLDAIFVHDSVVAVFEQSLKMRIPPDEFLCFRKSSLWMQMPVAFVREWFFARHPAMALGMVWSNISALSLELGHQDAPFTLDY